MKTAFVTGWQTLISFLIGCVYLWPLLLLVGIAAPLVLRIRRRHKNRDSGAGLPS